MYDSHVLRTAQPGEDGQSFRVTLLSFVIANTLLEGGDSDKAIRPVWCQIGGTAAEVKAFLANIKLGVPADEYRLQGYGKESRFEFLRGAGYRTTTWSNPESPGVVATIYLPGPVTLTPGMIDPERCRFLAITPRAWATAQAQQWEADGLAEGYARYMESIGIAPNLNDMAMAFRTMAYMRFRTRRPMPVTPEFAVFAFRALRAYRVFPMPKTDRYGKVQWLVFRPEQTGYYSPVLCDVPHDDLDRALARVMREFMETGGAI